VYRWTQRFGVEPDCKPILPDEMESIDVADGEAKGEYMNAHKGSNSLMLMPHEQGALQICGKKMPQDWKSVSRYICRV